MEDVSHWLYDHLNEYIPFQRLFQACRGNTASLDELAATIFNNDQDAMPAIDVMLALAPLAHDINNNMLFPARMHMLFRGFSGVYACMNPNCRHSHSGNGLKLGEIFLDDKRFICPECKSRVYELYTDRRCGALYLHGFVDGVNGRKYLWSNKGYFFDDAQMKEVNFYLPMEGDKLPENKRGRAGVYRCWLDYQTGYITFHDGDT